jgi:hypothetical protein
MDFIFLVWYLLDQIISLLAYLTPSLSLICVALPHCHTPPHRLTLKPPSLARPTKLTPSPSYSRSRLTPPLSHFCPSPSDSQNLEEGIKILKL